MPTPNSNRNKPIFEIEEPLKPEQKKSVRPIGELIAPKNQPKQTLTEHKPLDRSVGEMFGDIGLSLAQGVVGAGEGVVGLGDLVSGGRVGKLVEDSVVDFGESREFYQEKKSDYQKEAERKVSDAEGVMDTLKTAVTNPTSIMSATVESLPLMFGGARLGRFLSGALGIAGRYGTQAAGRFGAVAGEGMIGGGMAAEQIRGENEEGLLTGKQSALAASSGVGTAMFGYLGSKVAQRLGIADIDVLAAGGDVVEAATKKGFTRSTIEGAFAEGLLEELPQSIQEQIFQNVATDRDPWEGIDEAAVMGSLAGMAMGGPAAGIGSLKSRIDKAVERGDDGGEEISDEEVEVATNEVRRRERNLRSVIEKGTASAKQKKNLERLMKARQRFEERQAARNEAPQPEEAHQETQQPIEATEEPTPAAAEQSNQEAVSDPSDAVMDSPNLTEQEKVEYLEATRRERNLKNNASKKIANSRQKKHLERLQKIRADLEKKADIQESVPDEGSSQPVKQSLKSSEGVTFEKIANIVGDSQAPHEFEVDNGATITAQNEPKEGGGTLLGATISYPDGRYEVYREDESGSFHVVDSFPASTPEESQEIEPTTQQENTDDVSEVSSPGTEAGQEVSELRPQGEVAEEPTERTHSYSNTQINLPDDVSNKVKEFGSRIPEEELYVDENDPSYGREDSPHVTVRYGLDTDNPADIEKVSEVGPISVSMGDVSIFESDDYDVVKVDLDGESLRNANKKIGELVNVPGETFTDYKPHATIAYVKKGEGQKYVGDKTFNGEEVTVDELVLVDRDGNEHPVKLAGKGEKSSSPETPDNQQTSTPRASDAIEAGQSQRSEFATNKNPWEMTRAEFDKAVESGDPGIFSENYEIDWGNGRGQGKRTKGMVTGAMSAAPKGVKKYTSLFAKLPDYEDVKLETSSLKGPEVNSYLKARAAGFDHDTAMFNAYPDVETHRAVVEKALRDGENVPESILDEYPEQVAVHGGSEKKQPEQKKAQEKIEDFGEVLIGARKHYAATLSDAEKLDTATVPLSKAWPEPNYQDLLDKGFDPYVVAMVRTMRDSVPTKGRSGWKVQQYVKSVEMLRGFAKDLLSGEVSKKQFQDHLNKDEYKSLKEQLKSTADLYQAVGHKHSLKGIKISVGRYSVYNGEHFDMPKTIWSVEKKAKATAFSNWPKQLAIGDTREEAIDNFKKKADSILEGEKKKNKGSKFVIWRDSLKGKYFVGKKFSARRYLELEEFDDLGDARKYLNDNQDNLEAKLEKIKKLPNERKSENAPRVGEDHLKGADVTPEMFADQFGFRGVQFGNYVDQKKRQDDLNEAYDALMDMAGVLDVPAKALSLNGELGLAFGARGHGGKDAPSAHYEPDTIVINLTKRSGAGSLAHEWWHALDNYFNRNRGEAGFITENPKKRDRFTQQERIEDPTRQEMLDAFKGVMDEISKTGLPTRSIKADQAKSKAYFSDPVEMSARAFENFIIEKLNDNNGSNDYLANIVSQEYWDAATALGLEQEDSYPYLTDKEKETVIPAYQALFDVVEAKKTDNGVALFSLKNESAVVELTGDEVGETLEEARKYYQTTLQGKDIVREGFGTVRVTGKGWKKAKRGLTTDTLKVKLFAAIPDVIRKGEYLGRFEIDGRSDDIVAFHHFSGNVSLSGDLVQVGVSVGEDSFGNLFYNINHDSDKLLERRKARLLPGLEAQGDEPSGPSEDGAYSLTPDNESVNLTILSGNQQHLNAALKADIENLRARVKHLNDTFGPIVKRWKNAPTLKVVEAEKDLPQNIQKLLSRNENRRVRGAYSGGNIYLVGENISNNVEAAQVLLHEAIGHYGMRQLFGADFNQAMNTLFVRIGGKNGLKAMADRFGIDLSAYKDLLASRTMDVQSRNQLIMDEFLAHIAEQGIQPTIMQRIVSAIRKALRRLGLQLSVSDTDLINLVADAKKTVVLGGNGKYSLIVDKQPMAALNPGNDPAVMDRMKRQLYVPEQIHEGTQGIYAEGSKIAEAEKISRRSLRAIREIREISRSGWPEGEYRQVANQSLRPEEAKALKAWAEENGLMLDNDGFNAAWELAGKKGGTEHDVYFNESDSRWYKRQRFTLSDTFTDYFQRLALTNHLNNGFAEYRLEGFVENDGELEPVVSQADIAESESAKHPTIAEVNAMMEKGGFVRTDKAGPEHMGQFRIPGQDFIISDHYKGNAVREEGGNLVFIDPLIKPDLDTKKDRIEASILADKFGIDEAMFSLRPNQRNASEKAEKELLKKLSPDAIGLQFQALKDMLPERMKDAVGKVLSNPHWGSHKSKYRSAAYQLSLDRGANANEIKYEVMAEKEGYSGLEGVRDHYKGATKKEKAEIDKLLVDGDIKGEEYTAEELDKKGVSKVAKDAYLAFRQTIKHATEVMFDRLGKLRLIPYEGTEYYQELVDLLDSGKTQEEVKRSFGIDEGALNAYHKINQGIKALDAATQKFKKEPYYDTLKDLLIRGVSNEEVLHDYGLQNKELVKAYYSINRETLNLVKAENYKSQPYYKKLIELLTMGENHPMHQKLELFNAYMGVKEYDSQLAKLKDEWKSAKGYLPRIRKDGEQHVKIFEVFDDGTFREVFMQPTKTKHGAEKLRQQIEQNIEDYIPRSFDPNAQYEVVAEVNQATPEEIFMGLGSHRSIEALLSRTFEKAVDAGVIENAVETQQEVLKILANEISARGFGRHKISRAQHLIEGYETENTPAILSQFIGGMAGWLSKSEFAMRSNKLMADIPGTSPHDKTWIKEYVDDALKNSTYIDQWFGTARSFAALMYLGFKASSAALNATQNYIWGQAKLSVHTKNPTMTLLKAQHDVVKDHILTRAGGKGILNEEERWVLEEGIRRGRSHANYVRAMSGMDDTGGVMGTFQSAMRGLTEKAMMPFQAVESYWNREPALIAAYRVFRKDMSKEDALKKAEQFVDDVHFVVGKENIPALLRKMGPLGRTLYTFQSYSHNYLLGMFSSMKNGEAKVVMRSLTALVLFGGLAALPFGDDLDKWYRKMFGERPLRMLEKWLKDTAGEYTDFGDQIGDFVIHGIPALGGVNFSRSLAVNVPWFSAEDDSMAERLIGVWGGMAQKVRFASISAGRGDAYRAAEYISPEAIANIMRAYRHYSEGATTMSGIPVFGNDGKQVKYSAKEGVIRAFGFMPLSPSKQTESRWDARLARQYWQDRKADILARFRAAKTPSERKEVMKMVAEFNRERSGAPGGVLTPPITGKTLRGALRSSADRREIAYRSQTG